MDRRHFLRLSGGGILLLSGLPMISGCSGVKRDDLPPLNGERDAIKGLAKEEAEEYGKTCS